MRVIDIDQNPEAYQTSRIIRGTLDARPLREVRDGAEPLPEAR